MLLVLALAAVGFVCAQVVVGYSAPLAAIAPVLLVTLPLLAGRYVGEDVLDRLRSVRAIPAPARRRPAPVRVRPSLRATVRGGVLIATNLSRRPPPLPA